MAATRLIPLHVNKGKTIAQSLGDRTDYAKNPEKTEKGELVTGYQSDPMTVDEEFMLSKRQYEQITGRRQKHEVIAYQYMAPAVFETGQFERGHFRPVQFRPLPLGAEAVARNDKYSFTAFGKGSETELDLLKKALTRTFGSVSGAAELLGLSRQNLYYKMKKYGLDKRDFKKVM